MRCVPTCFGFPDASCRVPTGGSLGVFYFPITALGRTDVLDDAC